MVKCWAHGPQSFLSILGALRSGFLNDGIEEHTCHYQSNRIFFGRNLIVYGLIYFRDMHDFFFKRICMNQLTKTSDQTTAKEKKGMDG